MSQLKRAAHRAPAHMTFDTIVPCAGNMQALQMAILVAENGQPSETTASLYLYGPPGVGKTHLLSAVANGAGKHSCLLISVPHLAEVCEGLWETGATVGLRTYLLEPDILLLDDLTAGKNREKFYQDLSSAIELRIDAGLAVVATADGPPATADLEEARFSESFGRGNIERMAIEDESTRAKILKRFLGRANGIPNAVVKHISADPEGNGHTLKELSIGVTVKLEVHRVLTCLGFQLQRVDRLEVGRARYIFSRWSCIQDDRHHYVDLFYSLTKRVTFTPCWSRI